MRIVTLRLAVPLIAGLLATVAPAQASGDPIACIYTSARFADILIVGSDVAARERVSEHARSCAGRHGWADDRARSAYEYAVGRAIYEDAIRSLARRGIGAVIVDQVGADLGEARIAALAAGETTDLSEDDIGRLVVDRLEALRYRGPPDGSPEWGEIGVEVGRGMAGKYFRERAVAAFDRR